VIFRAHAQSWWFYCSDHDIPYEKWWVTDPDSIPDWVERGCFAFVKWTYNRWHAVYIGAGHGRNAQYWAHNDDYHLGLVRNLLTSSSTDHMEFYKPLTISIKE
jgi:hypothetical protein